MAMELGGEKVACDMAESSLATPASEGGANLLHTERWRSPSDGGWRIPTPRLLLTPEIHHMLWSGEDMTPRSRNEHQT